MPSQPPQRDREAERRLNVGTVAIASAASATAALIVSQLWIAGTWIAAAMTPVLVAIIAEVISRPTEKIKGALTTDTTAVFPAGEDPAPRRGDAPEPDPDAPRPGSAAPVPGSSAPVYRAGDRAPQRSRRRIALGAVLATAAIAFVIAGLVITVPELIAGQSIGQADRGSTFLGGTPRKHRSSTDQEDQSTVTVTTPADTVEQTVPEQQPTETATTPMPTETAPQATTPVPQATTPPTTTPAP
jgi:hypothetical protein